MTNGQEVLCQWGRGLHVTKQVQQTFVLQSLSCLAVLVIVGISGVEVRARHLARAFSIRPRGVAGC